MIVGMLHPGAMGAAIGAQLRGNGHEVRWCRAGRSAASVRRAEAAGLVGVGSLGELVGGCEVVFAVCPPEAAAEVAAQVAESGFAGTYVEANAVAPATVRQIADVHRSGAGATVLDGSIIGPPPGAGRTARLYLSGPAEATAVVAGLLAGSAAQPVRLDGELGRASALKVAFGSFQKISRVLAAISHALADEHGVTEHLLAEADALGRNALTDRDQLPSVAGKAWRWGPEMRGDAEAFEAAGLPGEPARAAATVLRRWDGDKDDATLDVATTLAHLRERGDPGQ